MDGRSAAEIAAAEIAKLSAPKPKTNTERTHKRRANLSEEKKQQELAARRIQKHAKKLTMASGNNNDNNNTRSFEDIVAQRKSKVESNKKARVARFEVLAGAVEKLAEAAERIDRIDEEEAKAFTLSMQELQYRRIATPGPRQGGYDTPCSSVESTPTSTTRGLKTKSTLDRSAAPRQLAFGGVPEDDKFSHNDVQFLPFVPPRCR